MSATSIERLRYLCDIIPPIISLISEEEVGHKRSPSAWSKKEILGHLIDSATNNHQRFVRAQFEDEPFIVYDQNNWVDSSRYQEMPAQHIISFWEMYNRHLLEVVSRIPAGALLRKCKTNETEPVSILWLVDDYVQHLEHHLRAIVSYE